MEQLEGEVSQVDKDGRNGRWSLSSRLNSLKDRLAEGDSTMQSLSSSLDEGRYRTGSSEFSHRSSRFIPVGDEQQDGR